MLLLYLFAGQLCQLLIGSYIKYWRLKKSQSDCNDQQKWRCAWSKAIILCSPLNLPILTSALHNLVKHVTICQVCRRRLISWCVCVCVCVSTYTNNLMWASLFSSHTPQCVTSLINASLHLELKLITCECNTLLSLAAKNKTNKQTNKKWNEKAYWSI